MTPIPVEIHLRPVEPDDLEIFFVQEQDAEGRWMAAFVPDEPTDRQAFNIHWAKILGNPEIVVRTIFFEDHVAGHIAYFDQFGKPSVSYWIGREFRGHGIATAALRLFLRELDRFPVHARVAKDNHGSIRVLEKCGFVVCGEDSGFANARQTEVAELIYLCDGNPS